MKTNFIRPLLFGLAGHLPLMVAQPAGTFTATGNMNAARLGHSATLLQNGKVLIAGGGTSQLSGAVWASAELYDPATGIFSATGNMTTPRWSHTATLLPDGRVLIAGGAETGLFGSPVLASAELYDPATGTFSAAGTMMVGRMQHTATLLLNGEVLIAGGTTGSQGSYGDAARGAELYDPAAGTFRATGNMSTERIMHTAALLANGNVLVAGGYGSSDGPIVDVEVYDPGAGAFTIAGEAVCDETPPHCLATDGPSIVSLLPSGQTLVAMNSWGPPSTAAKLYDPRSKTFADTGSMRASYDLFAAALLPSGKVLIAGDGYTASADVYDPASGTFSAAGEMLAPRIYHTATLLSNGTVLFAGGMNDLRTRSAIASAEIYTPAVLVTAPALFSIAGDGRGQGAIWQALTGLIASPSSPAIAGDILSLYTTSLISGGVIPPQVAIGTQLAEILYFGDAPDYPGYSQVNVRVPSGITPGPAVPVRLSYLGRSSNAVTIGAR
jgi:hypothetical protein